MFVSININSKNFNSIRFFINSLAFLIAINKNFLYLKTFTKKKKKRFTIQKSPHVNKKSKESFGYSYFNTKILLHVLDYKILINLLNKIKNSLLLDLKFKIKFLFTQNLNLQKRIFNINSFSLKKKKISSYLKLLDIYGEVRLINASE